MSVKLGKYAHISETLSSIKSSATLIEPIPVRKSEIKSEFCLSNSKVSLESLNISQIFNTKESLVQINLFIKPNIQN